MLHTILPVVWLRGRELFKQATLDVYECPVYQTRIRGDTYVFTARLPTSAEASKWILAGVAILLGTD